MSKRATAKAQSPSRLIDERIQELGDWRGKLLARLRALVQQADPAVVEEWKWSVPVWSHDGCTGETCRGRRDVQERRQDDLRPRGRAAGPDRPVQLEPRGEHARRAIDFREGEKIDERALKALIRAAVALNLAGKAAKQPAAKRATKATLLAGGNPQVARADGDAPVQAYIAAMPGWKRDVGRRLDALIVGAVPGVQKAVKWNSPFYGMEGRGWFLSFHVFTRYVKVTFFRGASLRPLPPGESRSADARHLNDLDIREGDALDEVRLARWIRQAAKLPGWTP